VNGERYLVKGKNNNTAEKIRALSDQIPDTRYQIPRCIFAAFALFIVLTISSSSQALDLPPPRGLVNDFAQVIQPTVAQQLEAVLIRLERVTGIEIAIVTVPSLEEDDIDDAAVRLFEQWGIGKRGRDEGLLVLAAINDRLARIEVGYGLEPIIPDATAGRVLQDVIFPRFKEGQYGAGLLQGTLVLIGIIEEAKGIELGEKPFPQRAPSIEQKPAGPLAWMFRILLLLGAALLFIRHPFLFLLLFSGGFGRGGGGGFGRGGGFGGFGGGLSGGGGASGRW
jgi:uncharacterized protein